MEQLVSIIVPVYQAAPYIGETIRMVRQQTFRAWELILVDDCSKDKSVEEIGKILSECGYKSEKTVQETEGRITEYACEDGGRVILICKTNNEGAARARNTGLTKARGRYIAFLDADDVWYPDKLEKEIAFMKDKQAGFVFTAYEFGDEDANPTGKVVSVPEQLTYKKALSRTVIFTTTVLIDREKVADNLIKMPDVASEDTATWWQILRAGYVAYGLNEVLAVYRRPAKSLSSNKFTAIRRIWNLYRRQEKLSVVLSVYHFIFWAYRAAARRI